MEQALVLGKISHRVPGNILEKLKKIEGVSEADLIFGPYDFYVTSARRTLSALKVFHRLGFPVYSISK